MSCGIAGSHRTGKSTLANAYSQAHKTPFLVTSASQVFFDMGLDPKTDYPLDIRLDTQRRILEAFDKQYGSQDETFITDRTPLDMMAYTLADVQRQNVTPAQAQVIAAYLKDCIFVTNRHFTTLVIVQPGIAVTEDVKSAPANSAYMEHISALVMGLSVSEDIMAPHFYIPRSMTDLAARVRAVKYAIDRTAERHASLVRSSEETGNALVFH